MNEEEELLDDSIKLDPAYPFRNPVIDNYCDEREAKVYLTKEDIRELGFLRNNPQKKIYQHQDKKLLFLELIYERDYSVKDEVVERVEVYDIKYNSWGGSVTQTVFYNTTKPNKEEIQSIIDNYV